jgi:hypothetical protein
MLFDSFMVLSLYNVELCLGLWQFIAIYRFTRIYKWALCIVFAIVERASYGAAAITY